MKFDVNFRNTSMVLRVISRGLPLRQRIRPWQALSNDTLRSKIGLVVVEHLLHFSKKSVLKPRGVEIRKRCKTPSKNLHITGSKTGP